MYITTNTVPAAITSEQLGAHSAESRLTWKGDDRFIVELVIVYKGPIDTVDIQLAHAIKAMSVKEACRAFDKYCRQAHSGQPQDLEPLPDWAKRYWQSYHSNRH